MNIMDIIRYEGFKRHLGKFSRIYLDLEIKMDGHVEFGHYSELNVVPLEISDDLKRVKVVGCFNSTTLLFEIPVMYIQWVKSHESNPDGELAFSHRGIREDLIKEVRKRETMEVEISPVEEKDGLTY